MTNSEAIKELKNICYDCDGISINSCKQDCDLRKAVILSIQALEQSDKINEVLMELEELADKNMYSMTIDGVMTQMISYSDAIEIIKDKLGVKESEENKDVSITD